MIDFKSIAMYKPPTGRETLNQTGFHQAMSVAVKRCKNRLTPYRDASQHPFPGTFPSVGGWRLPAHMYDSDPETAEIQAKIIAKALSEAGYDDEWYWTKTHIAT